MRTVAALLLPAAERNLAAAKRTIADLRLTKVQPRESDRFEDDIIYQDGEFLQVPRGIVPRE